MRFDAAVIGAGVMGCSTALHLARAGMKVALLDRGPICREASGVNAGTLTMQMTRAALIPYALHAHEMWLRMAVASHAALDAGSSDKPFFEAKLITARFYAEVILPPALAQLGPLKAAGRTVFALREDQF